MKLVIVEMSAEEMRTNKRVADSLIDGLTDAFDQICRTVKKEDVRKAIKEYEEEEEKEDE